MTKIILETVFPSVLFVYLHLNSEESIVPVLQLLLKQRTD